MYVCPYCDRRLKSTRGITSHISQTPACKQARERDIRSKDGSDEAALDDSQDEFAQNEDNDDIVPDSDTIADVDRAISETPSSPFFTGSPPRTVLPITPQDKYIIHTVAGAAQKGPKEGTRWDDIRLRESADFPFSPWANEDEYHLVAWLTLSKLSAAEIDQFLRLKYVCTFQLLTIIC
jgi:hypothetical protein